MKSRIRTIIGLLTGAVAFTGAVSAQAAPDEFILAGKFDSYDASFGNSNFGASANWFGQESGSSTNTSDGFPTRRFTTQAYFAVSATLFGARVWPLTVQPEAWTRAVNLGSTPLTARAYNKVDIMGTTVFLATSSTCGSAAKHATYCTSFDQSISKTFFDQSATFTVGPIPVTVNGKVVGTAHGNSSTYADVSRYLGIASSSFHRATASMSSGAYVTASLSAFAGVSGVLGVGVGANFRLIDIAITPTSTQKGIVTDTSYAGFYTNSVPIKLTSMSGNIDVWAQVTPFWKPTKNLISWGAPLVWDKMLLDSTADY